MRRKSESFFFLSWLYNWFDWRIQRFVIGRRLCSVCGPRQVGIRPQAPWQDTGSFCFVISRKEHKTSASSIQRLLWVFPFDKLFSTNRSKYCDPCKPFTESLEDGNSAASPILFFLTLSAISLKSFLTENRRLSFLISNGTGNFCSSLILLSRAFATAIGLFGNGKNKRTGFFRSFRKIFLFLLTLTCFG